MIRLRRELRYEPTEKRVRALIGDEVAVDSTRATLVWEPRRVVPSYAVPVDDIRAAWELIAAEPVDPPEGILHPGIAFAAHTAAGEPVTIGGRDGAGFLLDDERLGGHIVLDFGAFDGWLEEDEPIVSHPYDPYHRVDVRRSTRHVRIELDGVVIAESTRPVLLFETSLPLRIYLPREDLRLALHPSERRTVCPYKGRASYWSVEVGGELVEDLAWSYEEPLPSVGAIAGLVAFWNERVDVVLDGEPRERPRTLVSEALLDEVGI